MGNSPSRVGSAILEILEASDEFTAAQRVALAKAIETGIETFQDELLESANQLKQEAGIDGADTNARTDD